MADFDWEPLNKYCESRSSQNNLFDIETDVDEVRDEINKVSDCTETTVQCFQYYQLKQEKRDQNRVKFEVRFSFYLFKYRSESIHKAISILLTED